MEKWEGKFKKKPVSFQIQGKKEKNWKIVQW